MFERFPSLTRFSHGWTITEKLDGTNAAVVIADTKTTMTDGSRWAILAEIDNRAVWAQSRSKLITPGKGTDNHGFARFVQDNAEAFVELLGEGRHFGEWVGPGVNKRHYNLKEKQFALFNTYRWTGADLPERVTTVPSLVSNTYLPNPGATAEHWLNELKRGGSYFGPRDNDGLGFMNPEGVVMYHGPSKTTFKKTFDYDEQGKWAEKNV